MRLYDIDCFTFKSLLWHIYWFLSIDALFVTKDARIHVTCFVKPRTKWGFPQCEIIFYGNGFISLTMLPKNFSTDCL